MSKKPPSPKDLAIAKAKEEFASHLCSYLQEEFSVNMGRFDAEDLFEDLFRELAPMLYNQALLDARDHFTERFTVACEDVHQLEIALPKIKKSK